MVIIIAVRKLFFILFILIQSIAYSQSSIKSKYEVGFDKGFLEGYCYNQPRYNCFAPTLIIAPYPRVQEDLGDYTQGYNRGFQMGLDLQRFNEGKNQNNLRLENTIREYNKYINTQPVDAMVAVGMYKQQLYDSRVSWIGNRLDGLAQLFQQLFTSDNLSCSKCDFDVIYEEEKKSFNLMVSEYKKVLSGRLDYSDNQLFSKIQGDFNALEVQVYENYSNAIRRIKQKERN